MRVAVAARRRRGPLVRPPRERGSVSVFLAIGLTAVFMIISLSVDGGGELREQQRAVDYAAEAARTGGQQINIQQAITGSQAILNRAKATQAVMAYLRTASAQDGVTFDMSKVNVFFDNDVTIGVTVTIEYSASMLSFFDLSENGTVPITGTARAVLVEQ
jgi:Flp pilus assembly protein TadG